FDLYPSARAFPIVAVNGAPLITMRVGEILHARDGEGCERLLNGVIGRQKTYALPHKTSPSAFGWRFLAQRRKCSAGPTAQQIGPK
ncbi:hypothetical protein QUT12_22685, partial [Xanthomonas citri pv. citri]